jgi:uncharacterized oxidoreductase
MKLSGNTILITGGGSGIGLGLAKAFAKLDNQVLIAGRSPEKLESVLQKGFVTETADLSDLASIKNLAKRMTDNHPGLNVIIHSAGVAKNEDFIGGADAGIEEEIITTNILGPMRLTNALLPHLLKQESATIMPISSGLAFMPNAQAPTYSSTKAAIHSYAQSLRYQLKDTSVEVIELIPPYVQTSMLGASQARDPNAMPLDEYISEVMQILKEQSEVKEILVERVKEMRFLAEGGEEKYEAFFKKYNDRGAAANIAKK